MLCEKCGKMNDSKSEKCCFCGAPMPARIVCGGFGDILDYEAINASKPVAASAPTPVSGSLVDPVEMKKLSAQVKKLKASNKKLSVICLSSIALAVVAIVVSIILICVGLGDDSVKNEKDLDKTPISESNNTESEIDDTDTADKTDIVNDAYEAIEKSGAVLKPVEVTSENSTENEGENSSSGTNVEDTGNNLTKETTGE